MRIAVKVPLALTMLFWSISPSMAAFWNCDVPEIDGPAGVSAIAALVSVGMIAYQRYVR
ncbi:MAG TPA: hypothetical protein VFB37_13010 [Steroidobacteraceae bacterium]|nr:hypothetical protein [Steroidobacteraceae bacterium]